MINIVKPTKEKVESKGGLILIGKIAAIAGLQNIKSNIVKNAGNIITSLFGNMTEGKTDFESIGKNRGESFFKEALDLAFVYAKETVRIYLVKMSIEVELIISQLRETSIKIIQNGPLHGIWINSIQYLPIDMDTTALDNSKTKKEGVSRTYKGYDGYHPQMAYVGKEGYILDCELRPGSHHCQNGAVAFIKGLIKLLGKLKAFKRYLFRMDSGNDSFETIKTIIEAGKKFYFIIKRNKRQESDELWLERAKKWGKSTVLREGKKVWIGIAENIHPFKKDEMLENVKCVFEIIERKTDHMGNQFLIPEPEINLWWTNLDCDAEKVIQLYHDHATSEQFHGELKHDMGVERLPSGKMNVNKIIFAIAMNAYNALKVIGQMAIEAIGIKRFKRKRLGKVIIDLICVAGKLVRHARSKIFLIYEYDPVYPIFEQINNTLNCLQLG